MKSDASGTSDSPIAYSGNAPIAHTQVLNSEGTGISLGHDRNQDQQQSFVENVGLLFETVGLPRMAGRIFGWLLISNPPHQSPGELANVLQASKGSISTMTRLLLQIGLIERVSLPGQRRDYFRIRLNAWTELTRQRMAQITAFRELAEQGLTLMEGQPLALRQRLQEMRDVHVFFEREMPMVIERWEQQRSALSEEGN